MRLAFVLYKYFPFGGLARDFLRIANVCIEKGYSVDVYVMEWHGELNSNFKVHIIPCKGWSNHSKVGYFHHQLDIKLDQNEYDCVIGFNKIPGLDVYYAADPCYVDRFKNASFLQKLNPRYKFYSTVEREVFVTKTVCLMISDVQVKLFKQHYHVPDERLVLLPPGIDLSRRRPSDADYRRQQFRTKFGLKKEDIVVLMVGSSFKTKGVDRAIEALAALPDELGKNVRLVVLGEGNLKTYHNLAVEHGVGERVQLMGGRSDVPDFLLAADLLLHPARKENTGTVILEAMVAGLPMLVTDVCGYAKHVVKSQAGEVLSSPFSQKGLNEKLTNMLMADKDAYVSNALAYADKEDLYSMPVKAVEAIERVVVRKQREA